MKQEIKIEVLHLDTVNVGKFKTLYKNVIRLDDSFDFDFKAVLKGLNILYPDSFAVTFQIS